MNTASSISIFWQLYTFCPLHITTVDLKSNNHHVTKVQTFSWKVSEINQLMQCFCKTLLINAESLLFSVVVVVVKLENLCFPTLWTQLDLQLWLSGRLLGATRKNWTTVLFVCKMKNKKQIQHADLEIAIGRRRWWRGNYTKPSELTISYAFFFLKLVLYASLQKLYSPQICVLTCAS